MSKPFLFGLHLSFGFLPFGILKIHHQSEIVPQSPYCALHQQLNGQGYIFLVGDRG